MLPIYLGLFLIAGALGTLAAAHLALVADRRTLLAVAGRDSDEERVVRGVLGALPPEQRSAAGKTISSVVKSEVARVKPELEAFVQTRRSFGTLLAGNASERSAFANTYEYDVTPSSDDAPFFFNYYRYSASRAC